MAGMMRRSLQADRTWGWEGRGGCEGGLGTQGAERWGEGGDAGGGGTGLATRGSEQQGGDKLASGLASLLCGLGEVT